MDILKNLFGRGSGPISGEPKSDDPIVPVPIPPLVTLLAHLERSKGSPLTEAEVWEARDKAVCMTMRSSARDRMAESRGFADINLENAWAEWQAFRDLNEFGNEQ